MQTASAETILTNLSGIITVVAIFACIYVVLKKIIMAGMDGKTALKNMLYYAPVIALMGTPYLLFTFGKSIINLMLTVIKLFGVSV